MDLDESAGLSTDRRLRAALCHSGALVSKDGSIDWCTFHRFEARPVFARLLDWGKGGFFRIAPARDEYEVTRRYLPGTNVLETRFETPDGVITRTPELGELPSGRPGIVEA